MNGTRSCSKSRDASIVQFIGEPRVHDTATPAFGREERGVRQTLPVPARGVAQTPENASVTIENGAAAVAEGSRFRSQRAGVRY